MGGEYGGGVSTRESMKGNTLLQCTTVTHSPSGTKGGGKSPPYVGNGN